MKLIFTFLLSLGLIISLPVEAKQRTSFVKRFKTVNLNYERSIILYGEIDENSVNPIINTLITLNKQSEIEPIFLIINSPGGYISDGMRLINTIEAIKAPVIGIIDGGAYSMAAVIALYVNRLYMMEEADMMFHQASYSISGRRNENVSLFHHIEKMLDKFDSSIAKKLKMSAREYKITSINELWLTADDVVERGLAIGTLQEISYKVPIPKPSLFMFFSNFDEWTTEKYKIKFGGQKISRCIRY